jgi:phosphate transport system substrate-binding protein
LTASLRRWRALFACLAVLALIVSACGGDDDDSTAGTGTNDGSGSSADVSNLSGTLNGSGSTFQNTYEEVAIAGFQEQAPKLTVNYNAVGSGQGKTDLANKVVDFAGTDSLVKPEDEPKYTSGGGILYFPLPSAPITVSYNVSGVDDLKLDAATLAKIFQGDIKQWDDGAIKALNDGADLPSENIIIAHRSDGSGTTSNFTKYLDTAAKGTWTLGSGDTVNWPAGSQAGNGNTGVAQIVKNNNGAIGYVDLADATGAGLVTAQLENKAGKFVKPTLDGASAAVAGATVNDDLTYSPLDAAGDGAYPITSPTWIITYKHWTDAKKLAAMKGYLHFILTDGQALAKDAGYAQLPDELAQQGVAQLDQLTAG